jgi:hypothetical protein
MGAPLEESVKYLSKTFDRLLVDRIKQCLGDMPEGTGEYIEKYSPFLTTLAPGLVLHLAGLLNHLLPCRPDITNGVEHFRTIVEKIQEARYDLSDCVIDYGAKGILSSHKISVIPYTSEEIDFVVNSCKPT